LVQEKIGGIEMSENNNKSILEVLKPSYRDGLFLLAGAVIDRFGVNYVLNKYKEQRVKENEEMAKKIAEILKDYKKE
jgi:hypothetical protein